MSTQSESVEAGSHVKWPSFQNVHRLVEILLEVEEVLALEKLDGSNLGLEIDPITESLIGLHGRNQLIWYNDFVGAGPFDRTYGTVKGTLHPLAEYIPRLSKMAQTLSTGAPVVVYGEWYQSPGDTNPAPAWHPFGYKVRGENTKIETMTLGLYQMFLDHDLTPPKILFSGGTIGEAVEELFPTMLRPDNAWFEGVVFTNARVSGIRYMAKWKTGKYDEQPRLVISDEDALPEDLVDKLRQVYETKEDIAARKREGRSVEDEQTATVMLAFRSVMSKSPVTADDIRGMDKESRVAELKRLQAETVEELKDQYAQVGQEMPKTLTQLVGKILSSEVMSKKK